MQSNFNTHFKTNIKTAPPFSQPNGNAAADLRYERTIPTDKSLEIVKVNEVEPQPNSQTPAIPRRFSDSNVISLGIKEKAVTLLMRPEKFDKERIEKLQLKDTTTERDNSPERSSSPIKSSLSPRNKVPSTERKAIRISEQKEVVIIEENGKLSPVSTQEIKCPELEDKNSSKNPTHQQQQQQLRQQLKQQEQSSSSSLSLSKEQPQSTPRTELTSSLQSQSKQSLELARKQIQGAKKRLSLELKKPSPNDGSNRRSLEIKKDALKDEEKPSKKKEIKTRERAKSMDSDPPPKRSGCAMWCR